MATALNIIYIIGLLIAIFIYYWKREKKSELERMLSDLKNKDKNMRYKAFDQLIEFNFSQEDGLKALEAATIEYPPAKDGRQDISAVLIDTATAFPHVKYINKIEEIYTKLNIKAKNSALRFLASYYRTDALRSYVKLLKEDYQNLDYIPTGTLLLRPRNPEFIFPEIFILLDNDNLKYDIYLFTLSYVKANLINIADYARLAVMLLQDLQAKLEEIGEYQDRGYGNWMWGDEVYCNLRYKTGVMIELAGFVGNQEILGKVEKFLAINDTNLKASAAVSLIKHNVDISEDYLIEIVTNPETSNWFHERLQAIGKAEQYPDEYRNRDSSNYLELLRRYLDCQIRIRSVARKPE